MRSALKELALIFTDQPGLLGPKVGDGARFVIDLKLKIFLGMSDVFQWKKYISMMIF